MDIKELAFENRKTLANLNRIDLLDIIEFLQEDRKQWIDQFTKTHNEGVEIQKENEELKSQLAGTTHCYDEQEHRELKKQLEVGEQQYNDLAEEFEKLNAENQVLKDYKNVALTYMKNYLKMELNYQNKDVAESI